MKKKFYIAWLVVFIIFAIFGSLSGIAAESTVKKQKATNKLMQIEGVIVEDESGNRNGVVTIESKGKKADLLYTFGKFKIKGAKDFKKGDTVSASYKAVKGDYTGELVSIHVKNAK